MRRILLAVPFICLLLAQVKAAAQPAPFISDGNPVDWLFVYKFNTKSFPQCADRAVRACPFGGRPVSYKSGFGQQYVAAFKGSGAYSHLKSGDGCLGDSGIDPVGATFAQIYTGSLNYVVWNDQFYNDPRIKGCGTSCASPWAPFNDWSRTVLCYSFRPGFPSRGSGFFYAKTAAIASQGTGTGAKDGRAIGCWLLLKDGQF